MWNFCLETTCDATAHSHSLPKALRGQAFLKGYSVAAAVGAFSPFCRTSLHCCCAQLLHMHSCRSSLRACPHPHLLQLLGHSQVQCTQQQVAHAMLMHQLRVLRQILLQPCAYRENNASWVEPMTSYMHSANYKIRRSRTELINPQPTPAGGSSPYSQPGQTRPPTPPPQHCARVRLQVHWRARIMGVRLPCTCPAASQRRCTSPYCAGEAQRNLRTTPELPQARIAPPALMMRAVSALAPCQWQTTRRSAAVQPALRRSMLSRVFVSCFKAEYAGSCGRQPF